jgi:uncharacterized protein (TIGR03083 family)
VTALDRPALLAHLRADTATFARYLEVGDLTAPVAGCPRWDLEALGVHVGRVHRWATAALGSDDEPAFPPRPDEPLAPWYAGTAAALIDALEATDPDRPCWTLWPPSVAGFWLRRQALETLVHRVDAEQALGLQSAIDPGLAAEGVGEVVDVMLPRQVALGRQPALPVALELRAGDHAWVLGQGEPAVLTADAGALLMLLWKRRTLDEVLADGGTLAGPRAAADAVLGAALTP